MNDLKETKNIRKNTQKNSQKTQRNPRKTQIIIATAIVIAAIVIAAIIEICILRLALSPVVIIIPLVVIIIPLIVAYFSQFIFPPKSSNYLDYYPLLDGTYGIKAGNALYLEKIKIPATYKGKSVTQILPDAFQGAINLKEVIIPRSISDIASDAFSHCTELKKVTFKGTVSRFFYVTNISYTFLDTHSDLTITCTDGTIDKNGNFIN